jgi:hypothetical protein
MSDFVDQVFNDAEMIVRLGIREQYANVCAEKRLYMAMVSALLQRIGGEAILDDREMLRDVEIHTSKDVGARRIRVWIEGDGLIEEIPEDQIPLPFKEEEYVE